MSFEITNTRAIVQIDSLAAFQWRDRAGRFHNPKHMETRHLFYTLRMIWNHSMPVKIGNFKRYRFGRFYTTQYMRQAVLEIGQELMSRRDLQPAWKDDLKAMQDGRNCESPPKITHEQARTRMGRGQGG